MTLLDWKDPDNVKMKSDCFSGLFRECTSLISAPALPATNLTHGCYGSMFSGCSSLTSVPYLGHVATTASGCFNDMFYGCSKLKFSNTNAGVYKNSIGKLVAQDGNTVGAWMFVGTGGGYIGDSVGDAECWTSNEVVYAEFSLT